MTKKEIIAKIYEAQKEISEAKEAIARGNHVLDVLISELNAKEAPKDPSFIVDDNGVRWFLAGQAARALGVASTGVKCTFGNMYIRHMRKAGYHELSLLGAASTRCDVWLISEVGLKEWVTHRRGLNMDTIPSWLGENVTIKPIKTIGQIIMSIMSDGNEHACKEIESEIVAAGYSRTSVCRVLDRLLRDNVIIKVNRGVYKLADKATIVPVNPVILKEAK